VKNGGLRGLWATLSPPHEAWSGVAVLSEVMCHVDIVRKGTGTRRELWIAREVSCNSSKPVSVLWRLSNEKGLHTELLMELSSGSNGGRSPRHGTNTNEKKSNGWAIAVRSLHSTFGGPGALCVKNGDLRGLWGTRSPTHEAWSGVAVVPEVRYHMDIVRKGIGTRRELWIAREVSCKTSGTASVLWRLSNEKGQDTELLIELSSGSNGRRSPKQGTNSNE